MENITTAGQNIALVAAPLVVAMLCLYAHSRRIGGRELLLWAAAHLFLALAFLLAVLAPPYADLHHLPMPWRLMQMMNAGFCWLLLFGVLAMTDSRITPPRGVLAALVLAGGFTLLGMILPQAPLLVGLVINPLVMLAGAVILVWRKRSAIHLLAGLVLTLRGLNGFLFTRAIQEAGGFFVPEYILPLAIFFNFLTGVCLLAITVENAWQRLGAALEEARFSAAVMELAPVSILHKDRNLRILRANRNFTQHVERFQHGHDSVLGDRSGALMPLDGAAAMERLDLQLLAEPEIGPLEREVTLTPADGEPVILLVRKAAMVDESGAATGIISASLDITRLKAVEAELRRQIAMAEQASKAKSDFLANMSHELRTPLNGIQGFADMLAAGYLGELNARQREYVGNILQSSQQMLALVSTLLDLSKLDAGSLALRLAPVDLGGIVAALGSAAQPLAARNGLTLEWHNAAVTIQADAAALQHILGHLVDNAIKFNRPGGWVRIEQGELDGRAMVRVADGGQGMTPAQLAAAGDPFLRADPMRARQGGGSGLGLAVSRGLAEMQGGELRIESRPGHGTIVTLLLPAPQPLAAAIMPA